MMQTWILRELESDAMQAQVLCSKSTGHYLAMTHPSDSNCKFLEYKFLTKGGGKYRGSTVNLLTIACLQKNCWHLFTHFVTHRQYYSAHTTLNKQYFWPQRTLHQISIVHFAFEHNYNMYCIKYNLMSNHRTIDVLRQYEQPGRRIIFNSSYVLEDTYCFRLRNIKQSNSKPILVASSRAQSGKTMLITIFGGSVQPMRPSDSDMYAFTFIVLSRKWRKCVCGVVQRKSVVTIEIAIYFIPLSTSQHVSSSISV